MAYVPPPERHRNFGRRVRWIAVAAVLALVGFALCLLPLGCRAVRRFLATTALYEAVRTHDPAAAQASLQRGADPNAGTAGGLRGGTPLAWAVDEEDRRMIRLLLEHGANPLAPDSTGKTAMDYARARRDQTLIDLLVPPKAPATR